MVGGGRNSGSFGKRRHDETNGDSGSRTPRPPKPEPRMVIPPADLRSVQELYDAGQYARAYAAAQEHGPFDQWAGAPAQVLAGRLANRLGARHLADTLIAAAFRGADTDPDAVYFYARTLLSRRGPLFAWRFIRRYGDLAGSDPVRQAEWLAFHGIVLAAFRDFDSAEAWMRRARDLAPTSPHVWIDDASVLVVAGRYEEALQPARHALSLRPWYRPGIELLADALPMLGRIDEAANLLREASSRLEDGSIWLRLADMQTEQGAYDKARESLERAAALLPLMDKEHAQALTVRRSEAAYHCGDIAAAAKFAKASGSRLYHCIGKRMADWKGEPRRVTLPVDFISQQLSTCFPATLATISRYWSQPGSHDDITRAICYDGTSIVEARSWAEKKGWAVREFTIDWDTAVTLIDRGVPFAVSASTPDGGHAQTVIGYDACRCTLLVRDSNTPHFMELPRDFLGESGLVNQWRAMVLVPKKEKSRLEGLDLPNCELYDKLYAVERALSKHARRKANKIYLTMERSATEHPLTIQARQAIAAYDGDSPVQIACADRLAMMCPGDARLQLFKLALTREHLGFVPYIRQLQTLCAGPSTHPSLWLQYAQDLTRDAQAHKMALAVLRKCVRAQPDNAAVYLTLGELLWKRRRYDRALELYRFASCLEYKEERYAQAYVEKLHTLRRTEEGLSYLRKRVERLGSQSSKPAVTLFATYEQLGRQDPASEAISAALERFPDDGALLLLLAAAAKARREDQQDAQSLLKRAKGKTRESDWNKAAGETALSGRSHARALRRFQQVARANPRDARAHAIIAALLREKKGERSAMRYVEEVAERFPQSFDIQLLRVACMDPADVRGTEQAIRRLTELDPAHADARMGLASFLADAGRLPEALRETKRALKVEPHSPEYHAAYIKMLVKQGAIPEARQAARRAIRQTLDVLPAVEEWEQIYASADERKELVCWIETQCVAQRVLAPATIEACLERLRSTAEPEESLRRLNRALEAHPEKWEFHAAVGDQLLDMNRPREALELARRAAARWPEVPQIWFVMGKAHRGHLEYAGAIEAFQQVLRILPDCEAVSAPLAIAHAMQGDVDYFGHVIENGLPGLIEVKALRAARSADKEALARTLMADLIHREANVFLAQKAYPQAARAFEEVAKLARQLGDPAAEIGATVMQAMAWSESNDRLAAHEKYASVLDMVRAQAQNLDYLNEWLVKAIHRAYGRYVEEAIRIPSKLTTDLLRVLDEWRVFIKRANLQDSEAEFLHHKAKVLYALDDLDEALAVAEDALSLKRRAPSSSGCDVECFVFWKGMILGALGRFTEQLACFDARIGQPGKNTVFLCRGLVRAILGNLAGAREDFLAGMATEPEYAYYPLWLAAIHGDDAYLPPFAEKTDWIANVCRFFLGRMTPDELLAEAASAENDHDRDERLCESHGFLGAWAERRGQADVAETHYRACVATRAKTFFEYVWARARLRQMGK